jgi:hypothetical protein
MFVALVLPGWGMTSPWWTGGTVGHMVARRRLRWQIEAGRARNVRALASARGQYLGKDEEAVAYNCFASCLLKASRAANPYC